MPQRTRDQLLQQITTLIPDNTAGEVSAADVRSVLTDIRDTFALQDATATDFPTIGIAKGGTGATTATAALAALGAAALVSPSFTGVPLAPTAGAGTNTTQIASTAYVVGAIAAAMLTGGSDGVLASAGLQPDGVTLRLTLSDGTEIDVNLNTLISGLITAITTGTGSGLTGGATSGTATLAIAARGVTLGMLASGTAGRIIGYDASGNPTELQLPSGGGGATHIPTAVAYSSGASRLTLTVAANAAAGDLVAFEVPTGIDDGTDDLVLRTFDGTDNGTSLDLVDIGGDNVTAADLTSGQPVLAVRRSAEYRLLTSIELASWDALTGKNGARPSRAEIVAGSSGTPKLWTPSDISEAVDAHDSSLIGPYHFRINENASQTDSQAAHFLGGIYRNISGRPLRVLEAFIPVHPGGGGEVGYNAYVWRLNRVSATSYLTPTTDVGNVENLRTASGGSNIQFDVASGEQTEIHGYSPGTVVIEPDDYFAVAVDRVVNGTNGNTIVASGADIDEDFADSIEYVAKASFAATFSVNRGEELYHNSSFAERMRLVFEFADGGVLPPIHGIQTEGEPEGSDKLPYSNERAAGTPNEYIEWDDAVALIRNMFVYEHSRPQASADNLHDVAISAVDRSADICLNRPHRTTESTGTWAAITPGTDIEYSRVRADATPVQSRYLYEYFTDDFWFGADVGGSQVEWVQDEADDALAEFLTTGIDSVQWLHHHASDAEALAALPALPDTHEAFYWHTGDLEIRKLTSSTFVPAGSPETSAHYVWAGLFAGDPEGDSDGDGSGGAEELFNNLDTAGVTINVESGFGDTAANGGEFELSRALVEADDDAGLLIDVKYTTGQTGSRVSQYFNHFISARSFRERGAVAVGATNADETESVYVQRFDGSALSGWAEGRFILARGRNTTTGNDILRIAAAANGPSPDVTDVMVRVVLEFPGGTTTSEAGGGGLPAERRIVSEAFDLIRSSNLGIDSASNWIFSLVTLDPVPIADIDSFSLGVRVGGREAFPVTLDRRAVLDMGHHPGVGWIWHGSEYDGASQVPCLMVSGKHNSEGQYRHSIQPIRQQIGYSLSNSDVTYLLFVFFDYDTAQENIVGMDVAAVSSQSVEIDWASLFFAGEAA